MSGARGARLGDAATGLRLALRGIAYRRATAAIVLALAVVAATAAVVAPLYARAAEQSIARRTLSGSDVFARSVHVDVSAAAAEAAPTVTQTLELARRRLGTAQFGVPVELRTVTSTATAVTGDQAGGVITVPLAERSALCGHLPLTAGRCPSATDEVALTSRSVSLLGLRLGDRLPVQLIGVQDAAGSAVNPRLVVVGSFEPFDLDDDYWVGRPAFGYVPFAASRGLTEIPPLTDTGFVGPDTLADSPAYGIDVPVDASRLDLVTGPAAAGLVERLRAELGPRGVAFTGQLPAIVERSAARGRVVQVAAPLAAAQLVLLAWVILAHVVASATQERAPELGLAKLRGQTPARTVRFGLAEVVVLLLVAAPVGTALGYLLVRVAAAQLLERGVRVEVTGWAVLCVVGGVVGGVTSAAIAARGIARRHVSDLLRRVPAGAGGRRSSVVEGAVLALVAAGVTQLLLSRGSTPGPVAVAGPGMVALGSALLAARGLRLLARRRGSAARSRGWAGGVLGWAGVARRPGVARTTGVLTAAVCLLLVGVQAWQVAGRERAVRALAETGAAVVYDAQAPTTTALRDAVRAADPTGRYAMAVSVMDGGDAGPSVLAVDTPRAAAVLGPARDRPAGLDALLRPRLPPPLVVRTGRVRVGLDVTSVTSPSPLRAFVTVDVAGRWTEVALGGLRAGARTYVGAVPTGCEAGCRLVGLSFSHPGTDIEAATADLRVTALTDGAGERLDAGLGSATAWRPGAPEVGGATVTLTPGAALRVRLSTPGAVPARVVHGDSPDPLPGLVAAGTELPGGVLVATSFTGQPQRVQALRRNHFIAGLGRQGGVVDLSLASAALPEPAPGEPQVWLARDDPAAERTLRTRLAADGVVLGARTAAATDRAALARDGAVLALLLFLACGAVAVVVAAGAMLVAAFVGARQRAAESASLRLVGVPASTVRRGLLVENVAGVAVALVAGGVGALVAALAVLPVLPLFDEPSAVLGPTTTPDVVAGLVSLAAVGAGLVGVAAVVALTQGRSGVDLIREGTR